MKLDELITIANRYYPEGAIAERYNARTGRARSISGDTLALFIVRELVETFDPSATHEEQLAEAARVLHRAARELTDVADAFAAAELVTCHPNGGHGSSRHERNRNCVDPKPASLNVGDLVWWNDPDDGLCSGNRTVTSVEYDEDGMIETVWLDDETAVMPHELAPAREDA